MSSKFEMEHSTSLCAILQTCVFPCLPRYYSSRKKGSIQNRLKQRYPLIRAKVYKEQPFTNRPLSFVMDPFLRGSMRDVNIQSIDKLGRTVANTAGSYGQGSTGNTGCLVSRASSAFVYRSAAFVGLILCTRSLPTLSTYFAIFTLSSKRPLFARINRLYQGHLNNAPREIILSRASVPDSSSSELHQNREK